MSAGRRPGAAGSGAATGPERPLRVVVDQERCCGSGMCVLTAPGVFDQRDEDGIVVLLDERPHAELWRQVRDAESGCPSQAIEVSEECEVTEVSEVSEVSEE